MSTLRKRERPEYVKLHLGSRLLLTKFKSPDTLRVFFFLVRELKYVGNNCVYIKQEKICKELEMSSRQAVNRVMQPLVEKKLISKIKGGYRINSDLVSIGSGKKAEDV